MSSTKASATSSGSKKGKPKKFDSHLPISPLLFLYSELRPILYVPLVFALFPAKTELCYRDLWTKIQHLCTERDLHLNPSSVHVDFEPAMHNVIVALFPDARIDCCSFHLGQAWWRNIQRIGLSSEYKDKSGEIGKWLSKFVGLPFLLPEEVADAFVEDTMADATDNEKW
jgi:hypothetical protein